MHRIVRVSVFVLWWALPLQGFTEGMATGALPNPADQEAHISPEGQKTIKKNDEEIRRLFVDVKNGIERIDDKLNNIKSMLDNKEREIPCYADKSMQEDIDETKAKIKALERFLKSKNADEDGRITLELKDLKARLKVYEKAHGDYLKERENRGVIC